MRPALAVLALCLFEPLLAQYQRPRYNPQPQYQPPAINQYNGQQEQQQYNQQSYVQHPQQPNNRHPYSNMQMQSQRPSGRTIVVNTPINLDRKNPKAVDGAQVQIQLTSYQNPDFSLSNTTTCACPTTCNFLPPTQQNSCYLGFVTVISSATQSVKYIQSDFNLFPTTVLSTGNWTSLYTFTMSTKPVAIDIFVQHLGVIIDKHTSSLLFFNYLTLVDSFVVDLVKYDVNKNSGLQQLPVLFGQQLKTQLHMSLSIQCINGMMGDSCELICENLSSKSQLTFVSCKSSITNEHFNCTYNAYNSQVTGCTLCTADGSNGTCTVQSIIEYNTGVSAAFRVWTIVLGCLLGIAVLFILCLIISYIIIKNRENDDNAPIFKSTQYGKGKSGNPPLLDDEWNTAPRRTVTVEPDRCPVGHEVKLIVHKNEPCSDKTCGYTKIWINWKDFELENSSNYYTKKFYFTVIACKTINMCVPV